MPRFHETNNGPVQFTVEEETARDAEEAAFEAGRAAMEARQEITRLEALETPRRLAESVLTDEGKAWLTANRDKIDTERGKL